MQVFHHRSVVVFMGCNTLPTYLIATYQSQDRQSSATVYASEVNRTRERKFQTCLPQFATCSLF